MPRSWRIFRRCSDAGPSWDGAGFVRRRRTASSMVGWRAACNLDREAQAFAQSVSQGAVVRPLVELDLTFPIGELGRVLAHFHHMPARGVFLTLQRVYRRQA